MSVTAFADKVGYSRRNVYEVFEKKTIDTGLLLKINKVLGQNLFLNYLSDNDINEIKKERTTSEDLKEILTALKTEVKKLKDLQK